MDFNNIPNKKINNILTSVAIIVLMVWAWNLFGPGSADVRLNQGTVLKKAGVSFVGLIWLGVAVVCGGYLFWRFMTYVFWRKYFNDEKPPDEPDN